jgi:hypothetical protein
MTWLTLMALLGLGGRRRPVGAGGQIFAMNDGDVELHTWTAPIARLRDD